MIDGQWQARCEAGPLGPVSRQAETSEQAIERLRCEIHYQLEWCPCSSLNREHLHLDIDDGMTRARR